jgi:hypothetical protein
VNNLQPLLSASASLSVNEGANALVLVATKTDVRRMLRIISALDSSIARVSSIKVFPLHYADADGLAPVVQQLFAAELFPDDAIGGSSQGQAGFSFGGLPLPGGDLPGVGSGSLQSGGSDRKKIQGRVPSRGAIANLGKQALAVLTHPGARIS